MRPKLTQMYGLTAEDLNEIEARAGRVFIMEDSRSNIKKLLKMPPNVAEIFHGLDEKHSFSLAKAFVLWAREQGSRHEQAGGWGENEPFRNEPKEGPSLLDPKALERMRPRDSTMQQFMREVGHSLLDSLKAKPNVVPQAVNKATNLEDVTAIVTKFAKRDVAQDKVIVKLPNGWMWVRLDQCENSREGEEMQHCATDGRGDLVSLRDPQGKPHVTMTYNQAKNTVFQVKGKQNAVPDKKYWSMMEEFFSQTGSKLKDRYLPPELQTLLSTHVKKTVAVKGPHNSWIEAADGLFVLVSNGTDIDRAADHAIMTIVLADSDYSNSIKSVKLTGEMSASEFISEINPLLKSLKASLDLETIADLHLQSDGKAVEGVDTLIALEILKYKHRKIVTAGIDLPVVLKIAQGKSKDVSRAIFADSEQLLIMRPTAILEGSIAGGWFIVNNIVSPEGSPGSANDIIRFDGKLAKTFEVAKVFGFETDCKVDGKALASELLPTSFAEDGEDLSVEPDEGDDGEKSESLIRRAYGL